VTRDDLRGRVWVADFIYTECTETCPTQSLQFAQLQREFQDAADLRLVSITVDPVHDTPEVLRRYAERYGATDRWSVPHRRPARHFLPGAAGVSRGRRRSRRAGASALRPGPRPDARLGEPRLPGAS
jgi:hypothetical protein